MFPWPNASPMSSCCLLTPSHPPPPPPPLPSVQAERTCAQAGIDGCRQAGKSPRGALSRQHSPRLPSVPKRQVNFLQPPTPTLRNEPLPCASWLALPSRQSVRSSPRGCLQAARGFSFGCRRQPSGAAQTHATPNLPLSLSLSLSPPVHTERRRSRSTSRERDRARRRERSRSRERRRSRSRSPHRRRSRSPRRHKSSSVSPSRQKDQESKDREISEADMEGKTEEEIELLRVMGFDAFDTTKGKKLEGSVNAYAVNVQQKRKYRQYMNRKGGFNRPLDFIA
ncbi:U4/U6.U5 small nuclear ribonucleoprotein 27 kDa protein-like [Chiloscyllium plagiosum]|uniref:U4/U6.U5 small nuclear ribonucleoprotein 27 kDa protein-like n=1 Tax=Chiloscyllium plagiosum TaxID=36176 RepID=UPI001CB8408F|nr:U4/U6.U5 small nuclear ribonucleoprotein 27 kDa protein-like [Chiloscyllium plagiosum]